MLNRTEFERTTPESVGISSQSIERLLDKLESGFTEMHGLMIMRHGKVCAEGWWSPYAPGLRHGLQSLSKTYAATGVGIAFTEGIVRLDERVIDIFPELAPESPSENLKLLTVRDVLCMGCGMDTMPPATENWIRDFLATPVNHKPGTTYMYNSVGSSILAAIVCRRSGETLHQYLTSRLFDKIGIDGNNMRWMLMPDGIEVGGGGLYATTEDNLRLMKLYADGGVWDGERILSAEYVRLATSLQNESATEAIGNPAATDNFVGYGFQIWMCRPAGVYRADGAMGQFSIVIPDRDMIISLNETATGAHWAQKTLDTVWEFLDEIPTGSCALPEDPAASGHLARRMKHLAIDAPVFAPFSPSVPALSGRWFAVGAKGLCFESGMMSRLSGAAPSAGIEKIRFDFADDHCRVRFVQDGQEREVIAATDGSRASNMLAWSGTPATRLLLSGYWSSPKTFTLAARWVETCFEKELSFTIDDDALRITQRHAVGGFGPDHQAEEIIAANAI